MIVHPTWKVAFPGVYFPRETIEEGHILKYNISFVVVNPIFIFLVISQCSLIKGFIGLILNNFICINITLKVYLSGLKLQATFIWYYHQKAKRKEKKKSSFFLPELHPR